jgi:hypothetical protein
MTNVWLILILLRVMRIKDRRIRSSLVGGLPFELIDFNVGITVLINRHLVVLAQLLGVLY